jgi:hypothetical protein
VDERTCGGRRSWLNQNLCLRITLFVCESHFLSEFRTMNSLALQRNTGDTGAMSALVEGFSWFVERPCPNSDVIVSDVVTEDGNEEWIRISGLDLPCDFLTHGEASALAGALVAASSSDD